MSLLNKNFKLAEFVRQVHFAQVPDNTTPADLLRPDFWAHCAATMKLHDIIEVMPENASWRAELIVTGLSERKNSASVVIMSLCDISGSTHRTEKPQSDEYEIKFRGPRKWSVIRKKDSQIMVENIQTEGAAEEWLARNSVKDAA